MIDIFYEIWGTVRRNKLRTSLTGFAVAWGILILIVLLGAGNGVINAIMQSTDDYLSNSMVIFPGRTSKPYQGMKEGRRIRLRNDDIEYTQKNFSEHVENASGRLEQSGTITLGEQYISSSVSGVSPSEMVINKRQMMCGRFINELDLRDKRKVLVIGTSQAKELLSTSNGNQTTRDVDYKRILGKYVNFNGIAFQVVGVYKTDESGMGNESFMPFSTMSVIYHQTDNIHRIYFSFHGLESEEANEEFEKSYKAGMNPRHDAASDDDEALWIWNRFTNNLEMNQGMSIIRTALWIIGILTLISGIVGVSNIMLIAVKERTHEFGIRKAIGAKPLSIIRLIMVESVVITTIFGYIGMLLGIGVNQYMDATLGHKSMDTGLFEMSVFVNPTVGLDVCIEATVTLIIAGTIAGLVPARKAANIRPIEALRAE